MQEVQQEMMEVPRGFEAPGRLTLFNNTYSKTRENETRRNKDGHAVNIKRRHWSCKLDRPGQAQNQEW